MFYCFVDSKDIKSEKIVLKDDNFHHFKNVLHAKIGEKVKVRSDNFTYLAEVKYIDKKDITLVILETSETAESDTPRFIIAPALIQEDHFDLTLQFCTQLGCHGFQPLLTKNVASRNLKDKMERWQRIIRSAAMQSQRLSIPYINKPKPWSDMLKAMSQNKDRLIVMPYELEDSVRINDIDLGSFSEFVICVGPEGGWTSDEVSLADGFNVKKASLGKAILRAETAAMTSLVLLRNRAGSI